MSPRVPLSIYVLFHPHSRETRELAHSLHDWFRLKQDDGDRSEAGIPIWFRSALQPGKSPATPHFGARLSPAIDWQGAEDNIVIVLADNHMVADRCWRHALENLFTELKQLQAKPDNEVETETRQTLILPIEVDWSLHKLGFVTAERNALRIGEPLPPGLTDEEWEQRVAGRAKLLRRGVTEAIARELVRPQDARGLPDRLNVFLSHAKVDGVAIAEQLRDSFAKLGQLRVWYDANDLPSGYSWAGPMRRAAGSLAGLVSVLTDAYHTRPWCREEVNQARTPQLIHRRVDPQGKASNATIWGVQPTVAVQRHDHRWSRAMAQLVHVPAIGWPEREDEQLDRIADVVDRLLLEVLLASFYRRFATRITRDHTATDTHIALITWVPEPWSLLHVISELLGTTGGQGQLDASVTTLIIAYPGHGLRTLERAELERVAASIEKLRDGSQTPLKIRLISQERLAPSQPPDEAEDLGKNICLSGGGQEVELEAAGLGSPHVDDFFVRIARRLLEAGCCVIYGGTLANIKTNFTQSLIDAARGWVRDRNATGEQPMTAARLDEPPFVNFSAWPATKFVKLPHHAELLGICRFERTLPSNPKHIPLDEDEAFCKSPEGRVVAADALLQMRRETSQPATYPVRILLGGKIARALGWMPGIAEELLCALEAGQLPLVIGGFGGCAGLIANYLANLSAAWPDELTFDVRKSDESLATLILDPGAEQAARQRFSEVRSALEAYREQLHAVAGSSWPFAEAVRAHTKDLLHTRGSTDSLTLVMKVVRAATTN